MPLKNFWGELKQHLGVVRIAIYSAVTRGIPIPYRWDSLLSESQYGIIWITPPFFVRHHQTLRGHQQQSPQPEYL